MDRYLEDRELNSVLEEYFNEVKDDITLNERYVPIEEGVLYWDTIHERASFTFMPRLKRREELKKVWNDCEKAEDLLNSSGEDISKNDLIKMGDIALRIIVTLEEISTLPFLPSALFIIGIPTYLIARLGVYALRIGEDALGKMYAKRVRGQLLKLKAKSKDKSVKDKCDKEIAKIEDSLKALENAEDYKL